MGEDKVIEALERCAASRCIECPFGDVEGCMTALPAAALQIIARLRAENRRLREQLRETGK